MDFRKITALYYSPTHTSARVCYGVAGGFNSPGSTIADREITHASLGGGCEFGSEDLVVVAVPVYRGRVAPVAVERLAQYKGRNTAAIAVVVYGNRDYEDALLELCDLLRGQGFVTVAAAAFVGEHSYSRAEMPTAQGRPDVDDMDLARDFGEQCRGKLDLLGGVADIPELVVRGNIPYKSVDAMAQSAPVLDDSLCVQCELCIESCPVEAISYGGDSISCSPEICTQCCRCVKDCPEGALSFVTPFTAILHTKFALRREPEFFI